MHVGMHLELLTCIMAFMLGFPAFSFQAVGIMQFLYGLQVLSTRQPCSSTIIRHNPLYDYWLQCSYWCKITTSLFYSSILQPFIISHYRQYMILRPLFSPITTRH